MKYTGLRFKIMAALATSLILLVVVQYLAAQSLLLQGYSKLESDKTIIQINNAKRIFDLQGQQFEGLAKDWAHWDDTYQYMAKPTKAYIETNYNNTVFTNIKVDAILLVNASGEIVYQMSHDVLNDRPWSIPQTLTLAASNQGEFTKPTTTGCTTRLLWAPKGLMMVSACNILPTLLNEEPRGTLIMVRLINQKFMQEINSIIGAKVNVTYLDANSNTNDDLHQIVKQLNRQNKFVVHPLSKYEVAGYTLLDSDISHYLILSTVSDRKIFEQRRNDLGFLLWSTGGSILLLLTLGWLFDKLLISPLTKLSKSVSAIDESLDCMIQLPALSGNDELTNLAQCINNMLSNLDKRQKALQESEYRWKFAIEGAGDGVWDWEIQKDQKTFSPLWKAILGYGESDPLPTGIEWDNRFHPDDQQHAEETMHAYLNGLTSVYTLECRLKCKNGDYKWVLSRGMVVGRDEDGKPMRMIGILTDISYRKQAERELKIAATAFESQEGMFITDANNIILRINSAFTDITGYSAEDAIGQNPQMFNSGRQDQYFYDMMWESISNTNVWEGEIWNRRKNGEVYPEHLTITAVRDAHGQITNYVATLNDITISKAASEEIKSLAFYDPLTKLPNRRLLQDRLQQALATCNRSGHSGALLFLDLDYFKTLNDTLGHDVGDILLQLVAERLKDCIREGDTVARLGGDEFVVLLEGLNEKTFEAATQVELIGHKILASLNQPYQLALHSYHSSPSIGITLFNDHNTLSDDLLKQADIAMYQAKTSGRNTLRFYDPTMQEAINIQVDIEQELRKAIEAQQFELHYQVQVDAFGRSLGSEALIRWYHPQRGMIPPLSFTTWQKKLA